MLGKIIKTEKAKRGFADKSGGSRSAIFLSRSAADPEKTIIGDRVAVEGSIRGEEDLEIAGSMKGSIELIGHDFRVGPGGKMEGDVKAQNVSVSGEFKGKIASRELVRITREAEFFGEIRARRISIEDGTYIKGVIELDRQPNRKPGDASQPGETVAPETGTAPGAASPEDKKEI